MKSEKSFDPDRDDDQVPLGFGVWNLGFEGMKCRVLGFLKNSLVSHFETATWVRVQVPLGGVRGLCWGRIPGCYVTKFAPHAALKLMA